MLDYRGCCVDPATGRDFMPAMGIVLEGRDSWSADGLAKAGIVSVHQGHDGEIQVTGDTSATEIWSFTDRMFMPAGARFAVLTGYGHYHETYEKAGGTWKIKTLCVTRIRVEAA